MLSRAHQAVDTFKSTATPMFVHHNIDHDIIPVVEFDPVEKYLVELEVSIDLLHHCLVVIYVVVFLLSGEFIDSLVTDTS